MPRQARQQSNSGIYHVMLRGNERKDIFRDHEDKDKFVECLIRKKKNNAYILYAYCVMDNHVHLVVAEQEQSIGTIMKRIGVSYAYYYNQKYKRVGHVFQDRFRSEAVENDSYLLSVIRYVHKNPVKAGIAKGLSYPWSSYDVYRNGDVSAWPKD